MKTLLKIQASLYGSDGQSSRLADRFVRDWLDRNPDGRVVVRDLSSQPVPHLTAERFAAFNIAPDARTPEQQLLVDESDVLVDEIKNADAIALAVPMYNFSVPSTLRAYFDHIARAGVTFSYSSAGPEGLLKGKVAYVFIARGGVYSDGADTQTPYLRQFLGFLGIEARFVYAEGLAMGEATRARSLDAAGAAIARLEPVSLAA